MLLKIKKLFSRLLKSKHWRARVLTSVHLILYDAIYITRRALLSATGERLFAANSSKGVHCTLSCVSHIMSKEERARELCAL
jgi:hypothetical protein